MTIAKTLIQDGALVRQVTQGDILAGGETINATLTTAGAGTILGSQLTAGILSRSGPGGAFNDTTDTAANIIAAMLGGLGNTGIQNGTTMRLSYINTVAFAMTLVAGTGVTLGSNVNCAASSVKDYLITVTNGTPTSVQVCNTTNASAVVTGMTQAQTSQLSVGQLVSGTGISGGTTVLSIQSGTGVTLSANATATNVTVALTFNPTVTINSLGQKLL